VWCEMRSKRKNRSAWQGVYAFHSWQFYLTNDLYTNNYLITYDICNNCTTLSRSVTPHCLADDGIGFKKGHKKASATKLVLTSLRKRRSIVFDTELSFPGISEVHSEQDDVFGWESSEIFNIYALYRRTRSYLVHQGYFMLLLTTDNLAPSDLNLKFPAMSQTQAARIDRRSPPLCLLSLGM
jgi:hypothetical protein